jgi:TPR repeat protein
MKWYRRAADRGHAYAQYNLGAMYGNGEGVPQNFVKAYVWWSLASANGNESAKKNLNLLRSEMTPQQVAQAQSEAAELWKQIGNSNK